LARVFYRTTIDIYQQKLNSQMDSYNMVQNIVQPSE